MSISGVGDSSGVGGVEADYSAPEPAVQQAAPDATQGQYGASFDASAPRAEAPPLDAAAAQLQRQCNDPAVGDIDQEITNKERVRNEMRGMRDQVAGDLGAVNMAIARHEDTIRNDPDSVGAASARGLLPALKERQQKLQTAFDSLNDGIKVADSQIRFLKQKRRDCEPLTDGQLHQLLTTREIDNAYTDYALAYPSAD